MRLRVEFDAELAGLKFYAKWGSQCVKGREGRSKVVMAAFTIHTQSFYDASFSIRAITFSNTSKRMCSNCVYCNST